MVLDERRRKRRGGGGRKREKKKRARKKSLAPLPKNAREKKMNYYLRSSVVVSGVVDGMVGVSELSEHRCQENPKNRK